MPFFSSISLHVSLAEASLMSQQTTLTPSSLNWRASSRPIPCPAPVTMATSPLRLASFGGKIMCMNDSTVNCRQWNSSDRISQNRLHQPILITDQVKTVGNKSQLLAYAHVRRQAGHRSPKKRENVNLLDAVKRLEKIVLSSFLCQHNWVTL